LAHKDLSVTLVLKDLKVYKAGRECLGCLQDKVHRVYKAYKEH
jgi:hypothetical protein